MAQVDAKSAARILTLEGFLRWAEGQTLRAKVSVAETTKTATWKGNRP